MGLKITTNTVVTDDLLPRLDPATGLIVKAPIDYILPAAGALLLFDAANPNGSDLSFLNAGSGSIDNLAWSQAQVMIPAANELTLKGVTTKTFNAGTGFTELSAKKGIHTAISQTASAAQQGFLIEFPDAIKTYLLANPNHLMYFSIWGRTTKAYADASNAFSTHAVTQANINTGKLFYSTPITYSPVPLASRMVGNDRTLGNYFRNLSINAWTGAAPITASALRAYFQYGSKDVLFAQDTNKSASGIFYKMYVEDLTVSGRTYAAVDAIDNTLYTAAFAAGGRFYGDTFTDPATIA